MNTFKQHLAESRRVELDQIYAHDLEHKITIDPWWLKGVYKPLTVIGYANLSHTSIGYLSPLVTFEPLEKHPLIDAVAEFQECEHLRVASGTFKRMVDFSYSGVTELKDLHIEGTDRYGVCLKIFDCNIKKVENCTFAGKIEGDGGKTQEFVDRAVAREIMGHTANDTFADLFDL